MKKHIVAAIAVCAVPFFTLTACGPKPILNEQAPAKSVAPREQTGDTYLPPSRGYRLRHNGERILRDKMLGAISQKYTRSGEYQIEYIHYPFGCERDETLYYKLDMRGDNTFDMTVISNGVTAIHNGRWYAKRGEIVFFYDENMQNPPHNVFICDSLYAEELPGGKLMIYDNGAVIVLSKTNQSETDRKL